MKVVLIVASLIALSWARKLPIMGDLAMQNPDLFEDDIIGIKSIEDRNAIAETDMRWPGGVVPFFIDKAWMTDASYQSGQIIKAMNHITNETSRCITFRERTNEKNYIRIFQGTGCYSYAGMQNEGGQELSLADGCYHVNVIVHELLHALGFFHEHNRADRDDYLNIYWENIIEYKESQFAKMESSKSLLYDRFDYESIMLYGEYAFSKRRGIKKTMEAKEPGVRLREASEKSGLSSSDVYRIKKLYDCV